MISPASMIVRCRVLSLLPVTFFACAVPGEPGPGELGPGDAEVGQDEQAIVGGSATTDYPAVPYLSIVYSNNSGGACSGTLVSPRVILTAAHCIDPSLEGNGVTVSEVSAYFGSRVGGTDEHRIEVVPAEDWVYVEDWNFSGGDFALVLLAHDASVAPIPFNTTALSGADLGRGLHLVGWGNTTEGAGAGTKRHVTASISDIDSWLVRYGTASANTCQGDSGGPGFLTIGGQEVVVSVTSWGTGGCLGESGAGRVDRFASSIRGFIDENDIPLPPEVAFVRPTDGETVRPGFHVQVDATDNTRIESLELWVNGALADSFDVAVPPYIIRAPEIADGPATLEVRATDNRGDTTVATVAVTVDSSCETAAECGNGYECVDSVCVPNEGATGDTCTGNEACQSGLCGTIDDVSLCTEECVPGGDSCPDGFRCSGGGEVGYCWPSDEDEGGCRVAGGEGGWLTLVMLGLAGLLTVRRRRGAGQ